jgi:hypothetical protein
MGALKVARIIADPIDKMGKNNHGLFGKALSIAKTSWTIIWESVRHPNSTATIDRKTGKVIQRQ